MMSGLLRFIKHLFPAARRAARELAEAQLVKEIEEANHAKMVTLGIVLAVVGATLSLAVLTWNRARKARLADEPSRARELAQALEVVLAKQEAESGRIRCEVRSMELCKQTHRALNRANNH